MTRIMPPARFRLLCSAAAAFALLTGTSTRGDEAPSVAGRWEGALESGGQTLKLTVNLERKEGTGWTGKISIPAQGAKDLLLSELKVDGADVSFKISGVPGEPSFKGKLAEDTESLKGDFTQGGTALPLALTRSTGAAAAKQALSGFDAFVKKGLDDWEVPGLAIAITKNGEVIYAEGFGKRDVENDLPVTPRTIFAIGSCSKAFTTFAMGTLVDENKLDWDKPVRTYIPGFRMADATATEQITPRDLVTHRSGLPRHDLVWYNVSLSRKEIVDRLQYFEFSEPFRATFQYNNLMFMTAGYLVETLTGKPWEDAIRQRVLNPLDMKRTNFSIVDSQKADDFAKPYDEREQKVVLIPFRDISNAGPAGSINSSVEDMAKWVAVHSNKGKAGDKQLLSASVLTDIHTPHMTTGTASPSKEVSPTSYGLGWFVDTYRGHLRVHHGGNIDGFSALTCLLPDDGFGIVILTNKNGTQLPSIVLKEASDRLLKLDSLGTYSKELDRWNKGRAAARAAKKNKESVRRSGTSPAHGIDEYAGEYSHPGYGTIAFELRDSHLVMIYNNIETPMEHWHYEIFNGLKAEKDPALEDTKVHFQTNLKGYVDAVAIALESRVKPIVFTKKPDKRLTDPDYLKRFTGDYELSGTTLTVRLQGNTILLEQKGRPGMELVPDRDDGFNVKGTTGVSVQFVSDKDQHVTEAALSTGGAVFSIKRKP